MVADAGRPQWLSVPAAPDPALVVLARAGRGQLLTITADHGVARLPPRVGSGGSARPVGAGAAIRLGLAQQKERVARADRRTTAAEQWPWAGNSSSPGFSANDDLERTAGREPRAGGRDDWVSEVMIDLGRHDPAAADPSIQRFDLGPGTADGRLDAAMDGHQLDLALSAGRHAVERAKLDGLALIWAQGQGIGAATTNQAWRQLLMPATTACACDSQQCRGDAFFMPDALELAPLAQPEVAQTQCRWCEDADEDACRLIRRHARTLADPYAALRCLGGFEHAALVGSALAAAQLGLAWRALGASACIALLLALRLNPSVRPWLHPASAVAASGWT